MLGELKKSYVTVNSFGFRLSERGSDNYWLLSLKFGRIAGKNSGGPSDGRLL